MKIASAFVSLLVVATNADFKASPVCIAGATCVGFGVTLTGVLAAQEAHYSNHKNDVAISSPTATVATGFATVPDPGSSAGLSDETPTTETPATETPASGSSSSKTFYTDEVCVKNSGSYDLKFGIEGWSDETNWYPGDAGDTKCKKLSGKGTPGDVYEVKIKIMDGNDGAKTHFNVAYYEGSDKVTFKCTGDISGWSCDCDSGCTESEPDCLDPVMSDVVTSNVQFTATSNNDFTFKCNNSDADTSLSCVASYDWTSTMTQSLTVSSSLTLTEGVTISLKEGFLVESATEGVSFTVSESFSKSETTTSSESYSLDSACTANVDPGDCGEIVGTFEYGILNADYTATISCSSGVSSSSSGTMEFKDVYSTELQDACTVASCTD